MKMTQRTTNFIIEPSGRVRHPATVPNGELEAIIERGSPYKDIAARELSRRPKAEERVYKPNYMLPSPARSHEQTWTRPDVKRQKREVEE